MCTVRERAEEYGAAALTDDELLSLILGKEKAYGEIANLSVPELVASGLTKLEAIRCVSVIEYARRICRGKEKPVLSDSYKVAEYCADLKTYGREHFRVIYLNNSNKVILSDEHSIGTDDMSLVSIKAILGTALRLGVSAIIVAHNHPDGGPEPSAADIDVTGKLDTACKAVTLRLLDHIIISKSGFYSFREHGTIL